MPALTCASTLIWLVARTQPPKPPTHYIFIATQKQTHYIHTHKHTHTQSHTTHQTQILLTQSPSSRGRQLILIVSYHSGTVQQSITGAIRHRFVKSSRNIGQLLTQKPVEEWTFSPSRCYRYYSWLLS